jgi:hypothetical protein
MAENGYQFISPKSGSENNTRESTIIIRQGEDINSSTLDQDRVIVKGSQSGLIPGELILSTDNKTIIFKPFNKFVPDETVQVKIKTGIETTSGNRLPSMEFSFHVTPLHVQPNPYKQIPELKEFYLSENRLQKTANDTIPDNFPEMEISVYDSSAIGEGYIYMAVASEVEGIGYYLMILRNDGTPLFARELEDDYAYDFKVQPNGLMTYAHFFEHHSYTGGGNVVHKIMDNSFTVIDSVQMGNGYVAEAHDFQILPNGHYLLFGYYLTPVDMSKLIDGGYPNALVSGGVVQELDQDKNVVFQWRSWDYYDFEEYPFGGRRDKRPVVSAFHLNTINLDWDNNIFLGTPVWTKKINRQTGEIMWHLGGYENEFSFVGVDSIAGTGYVAGHRFHRIKNGNVLVHDNASRRDKSSTSRVHEFSLDEEEKVATHIWSYEPDSAIWGWHRGSVQRLDNGNTVIGWGGSSGQPSPAFTEVNQNGEKVYELSFVPPDIESYRAFRFPFPDGKPADSVFLTEVGQGQTIEFVDDEEDTGIEIKINSMDPVGGYNDMTVKKYDYAPISPEFFGKAPMVVPKRMVWSRSQINTIEAEIRFDIDKWNIRNPENTMIYHREFEGNGLFLPLETSYNPATNEVRAQADKFGEFILTYPDLESMVFKPNPFAPEDSALVNQELKANLRWTPQGYVNSYTLQVATNPDFNDLVFEEEYLPSALYEMDVADSTTYFWRVKSHNDVGDSEWSNVFTFSTIAPFIELTSPKGGEQWHRGLEYFITWHDIIEESIAIHLTGDMLTYTYEIDTVASNGAYLWEIPFDLPVGNYRIHLISILDNEVTTASDSAFKIIDETAIDEKSQKPGKFFLHQNYPNPFNPVTTIKYQLAKPGFVKLNVYDITGERMKKLVAKRQNPGIYHVDFESGDLSSGIYFYRLEVGGLQQTRQMLMIK